MIFDLLQHHFRIALDDRGRPRQFLLFLGVVFLSAGWYQRGENRAVISSDRTFPEREDLNPGKRASLQGSRPSAHQPGSPFIIRL